MEAGAKYATAIAWHVSGVAIGVQDKTNLETCRKQLKYTAMLKQSGNGFTGVSLAAKKTLESIQPCEKGKETKIHHGMVNAVLKKKRKTMTRNGIDGVC